MHSLTNFYELSAIDLEGNSISFDRFRGQVVLAINTASECGFTYQYKDLEALYQKYKDSGFTVLAFPSNDFGKQEPGSDHEIRQFCEMKYRTTFPIFSKGMVKGEKKQDVYRFLTEQSAPEFRGDPGWNFVKFLIDKNGTVVGRFSSMQSPTGNAIVSAVEEQLAR